MLRPFQEFSTPRHILQDNQFDTSEQEILQEQEPIIPEIKIDHHIKTDSDMLIVIPQVLDLVAQSLIAIGGKQVKHLSTIYVGFPELDNQKQKQEKGSIDEEFDDEEQLYKSSASYYLAKQDEKAIKLYQIENGQGTKINFLTIPIFKSKLIYNLLSNIIFSGYNIKQLVTLGTGELNSNETINVLASSNDVLKKAITESGFISQIPTFKPPHFITGPIGSIISGSVFQGVDNLTFVAAAEGAFHLDLERVNHDSFIDLGTVLADYLKLDGGDHKFVKIVETKLKYKKAASADSSLYL
ncbi:unnamed protein product [Ambrosiozyma monospora]|uniref:Unnamed protein product n=1 Tax=Ambrosiozyma monospora TaxID=43982 RepID=A0ACB5SUL7_AMBMO|nr:unnamed protein product [Ambrosiozyma monospora]